jgi:hypothetical protein
MAKYPYKTYEANSNTSKTNFSSLSPFGLSGETLEKPNTLTPILTTPDYHSAVCLGLQGLTPTSALMCQYKEFSS